MKTCTICGAEWEDETKFCPNDGSTLRSVEGSDLIGSIIGGNYHIEKKLGEGGMGAVYLGEHVKMGRKSAIKVMTQAMANDPEAIARFNREATNAARINHPNVCAIYDFGETPDGTIFLAMEFIEGDTLGDVLTTAGGPLPLDRAANILDQTADALQAAHDLGIVHRDLKPDNIMIAKSRGNDLVKVVDFGIAKAMGGEEGQKVTKTGLVIGTPEYMSPEQLSGDVLDGRSDVYSLALVFFRVITGTLPFPAESAQETMIKRLTDDPLTLEQALPGGSFPPALQTVMDHALQRMPGDRFKHATELSAGVRSAMAGAPTSGADRPAVDTESATQILEPAGVTAQLKATAVTPAQAKPTPGTEVTEPMPAPAPSPRRPQKKVPVVPIAAAVLVIAAAGTTAAVVMGGGENGSSNAGLDPNDPTSTDSTGGGESGSQPPILVAAAGTTEAGGAQTDSPVRVDPENGDQGLDSADVETPPAGLDIGAIEEELNNALNQIEDDALRLGARNLAQRYYDDTNIPMATRAFAASVVAQSYLMEAQDADGCEWYGRASALLPADTTYTSTMTILGCTG